MRDVIVVGGGPAGATSALLLARAGFDVELIERQAFPRSKPCGDCISPGANAILDRLGVLPAVLQQRPARLDGWKLFCDGAHFDSRFAQCTDVPGMQTGYAISRDRFDTVLLDAARAAGVQITSGYVNNINTLSARLIIGADGLRSRVARSLGALARPPILKKHSFTIHARGVPDLSAYGEMHITRGTCLGIAPVEPGPDPLCNITVVMTEAAAPGARDGMRLALRRFPDRDLSHLVKEDVEVLSSGPFDWPTRRIAFERAILVGDAAGYFDPFTGQGIYQALAGAELAAEHASLFLRGDDSDALVTYETRLRSLVRPARRLQRAVEAVCVRPAAARLAFRALDRFPFITTRLLRATSDMA